MTVISDREVPGSVWPTPRPIHLRRKTVSGSSNSGKITSRAKSPVRHHGHTVRTGSDISREISVVRCRTDAVHEHEGEAV